MYTDLMAGWLGFAMALRCNAIKVKASAEFGERDLLSAFLITVSVVNVALSL